MVIELHAQMSKSQYPLSYTFYIWLADSTGSFLEVFRSDKDWVYQIYLLKQN
jgi:hypothetical protein